MENRIKKIFSDKLVTIKEDDTLLAADTLMENHRIRHLPVTDKDDFLVGILSRTDYLGLKKAGIVLQDFKVMDLMTAPVKVFASNAKVKAVAQLFVVKKISCGLVVEENEIIGIITAEDLIRLIAEREEISDEAERMDLAELADEGWISSTSLM